MSRIEVSGVSVLCQSVNLGARIEFCLVFFSQRFEGLGTQPIVFGTAVVQRLTGVLAGRKCYRKLLNVSIVLGNVSNL